MNKPDLHIKSYNDLLAEKQRLKAQFAVQKKALTEEVSGLKDAINPMTGLLKSVSEKVGKFTSPDKSMGLINTGIGFAADFLVRKVLLKKSGWLVKLALPFLLKNFISNLAGSKIRSNMPEAESVIKQATSFAK